MRHIKPTPHYGQVFGNFNSIQKEVLTAQMERFLRCKKEPSVKACMGQISAVDDEAERCEIGQR